MKDEEDCLRYLKVEHDTSSDMKSDDKASKAIPASEKKNQGDRKSKQKKSKMNKAPKSKGQEEPKSKATSNKSNSSQKQTAAVKKPQNGKDSVKSKNGIKSNAKQKDIKATKLKNKELDVPNSNNRLFNDAKSDIQPNKRNSRLQPKSKKQSRKKILPEQEKLKPKEASNHSSKQKPKQEKKKNVTEGLAKTRKEEKESKKDNIKNGKAHSFQASSKSDTPQFQKDTQSQKKKQKGKKMKKGKVPNKYGEAHNNYLQPNQKNAKPQVFSKKVASKKKNSYDNEINVPMKRENEKSKASSMDTKKRTKSKSKSNDICFEEHWPMSKCLREYNHQNSKLIRGKIRIMPGCGGWRTKRDIIGFVSCDRGSLKSDLVIKNISDANRALDGDVVYILLDDEEENENEKEERIVDTKEDEDALEGLIDYMLNLNDDGEINVNDTKDIDDCASETVEFENIAEDMELLEIQDEVESNEVYSSDDEDGNMITIPKPNREEEDDNLSLRSEECAPTWRDDKLQRRLWDPVHNITKPKNIAVEESNDNEKKRRSGKVVCVVPPSGPNNPPSSDSKSSVAGSRIIVGTLQQMDGASKRIIFKPNNRSLPLFFVQSKMTFPEEDLVNQANSKAHENDERKRDADEEHFSTKTMYSAEYKYGSWIPKIRFPPCRNVKRLGKVYDVEVETMSLLEENGVNHGDFDPDVLKNVNKAVKAGLYVQDSSMKSENTLSKENGGNSNTELGWKPTRAMYKGRRDYTAKRIFTIDPTSAKDLDDALHITPLPNNRVEIGVHIADVSHFVIPETAVDDEAMRRATTVYLVDRTVPMLPRPLCEIACSLNENVERLAFSCVWTMNMDGTLESENGKDRNIWYGKSVIKSCARLDYATAQNIIEGKVGIGEDVIDEDLWPTPRRPTGGHTIEEVCKDVRLMHHVAVARRKLRYDNGALALNAVKLAFQLEDDGTSPRLCEPYPIRDSNRLIEEYMLLANYLVAQRLITHAGGLACLRRHPPPRQEAMQKVIDVAQNELHFNIDMTNSRKLQESLSRLSRQCDDELALQCLTEMLTLPMNPAVYFAAGEVEDEVWRHFALNIPYYCHFTSPIRRYPDVIVHRLLQATIEGKDAVKNFHLSQGAIQSIAEHCNEKKTSSKKASDRSDRVFLALFLKKQPIVKTLGVVVGVGEKTLTVFVPMLGLSQTVFLEDHDHLAPTVIEQKSKIVLTVKDDKRNEYDWTKLRIKTFTKIFVSCHCRNRPPIDVVLRIVGPHDGSDEN